MLLRLLFGQSACGLVLFSLFCVSTHSQPISQNPLPTPEEFGAALNTCALGSHISVRADILGSIKTLYEGMRTQGTATLITETKLLELFPENDRIQVYKLYAECVSHIMPVGGSSDSSCDGMPGDTAWIYAGQYRGDTGMFVQGPFVAPEVSNMAPQDIKEGSWITLKEKRKTMILDYSTKGIERALDSPFRLDGKVSYTCKTLPAGERLYVAAKEVNGPSAEVRHVWFRVRLTPPGG